MTDSTLNIGDVVWAKMKGFTPWPGVITHPTEEMLSSKQSSSKTKVGFQAVYFFGTKNFGWVQDINIKDYNKNKEENLSKNHKTLFFKEACLEIEEFIKNGAVLDDVVNPALKAATKPAKKTSLKKTPESGKKTPDTSSGPKVGTKRTQETRLSLDDQYITKKGRRSKASLVDKSPEKPSKRRDSKDKETSVKKTTPRQHEKKGKEAVKKLSFSLSPAGEKKAKRKPVSVIDCDTTTPPDSLNASDRSVTPKSNYSPRVPSIQWPETPHSLNIERVSEILSSKGITPSNLKFGFIGLGLMGTGILKNIVNSGHKVTVWNRSQEKCEEFEKVGATLVQSPADVAMSSDVTFCCVSDPIAAKTIFFGNSGIIFGMSENKAYVEMSGIDEEASNDIAEALESLKARYLEVRFHGSKKEAEEGKLLLFASGDRSVYDECESCFSAISKRKTYFNKSGDAAKLHTLLQTVMAVTLNGLCEGLTLAERCGLSQSDMMTVLKQSTLNCDLIIDKCQAYNESNYTTQCALKNLQKDIDIALKLGSFCEQPLTVVSVTNEVFKRARRLGYRELDSSAIFLGGKSQATVNPSSN